MLSSFKIKEFALLRYFLVLAQLQNVSLLNRLVVTWPKFRPPGVSESVT
jgi:hypothetical protein